jgi:hypothetical protein
MVATQTGQLKDGLSLSRSILAIVAVGIWVGKALATSATFVAGLGVRIGVSDDEIRIGGMVEVGFADGTVDRAKVGTNTGVLTFS